MHSSRSFVVHLVNYEYSVPLDCNIDNNAPMAPEKHHVILIRHCVRSTEKKIAFYNDTTEVKYKAKGFIGSSLPKWNTPKNWCTEHGMEIIKNTGDYILKTLLSSDKNLGNIQIQFISDSSQRDVDTSLALREGMIEAATKMNERNITVGGLQSLEYDHVLFKVFGGFCESNFTSERLAKGIQTRFSKITPPENDLEGMLQLLEKHGGAGKVGRLTDMNPSLRLSSSFNFTHLEGAINIVRLFSQMVIYSRASKVDPPFLPNISTMEIYELFAWTHWFRSVLVVDNVWSAIGGSVIANAVLEALEHGSYRVRGSTTTTCDENTDACVTILVGHEGTIDNFATAFGTL